MPNSFFDQIINGLFPDKGTPRADRLIVHELLSRAEGFKTCYQGWLLEEKDFILGKIKKAYYDKKAGQVDCAITLHVLNNNSSKGFAVGFDKLLTSKKEFQFLLEYFKEKVLALNYKIATADHKMIEKDTVIVSTERYYLKPRINNEVTPTEQRFGNIVLELILNNDEPTYLRLVANTYSDSNYACPEPFEGLSDHLF